MTKIREKKIDFLSLQKSELDILLESSIAGDSQAFSKISVHIRDIALSYFMSKYRAGKILNKDDAEDLTNSVYLSFAEQYNKIDNIENWLRRVIFLTFVRFYKKNTARKTYELNDRMAAESTSIFAENSFDLNAVRKVLETLSDEKQEIIQLRFWGELKFQEIADRLDKSEAAVKKMFYRTIEEIKDKLE